jgi:hypothetical protein
MATAAKLRRVRPGVADIAGLPYQAAWTKLIHGLMRASGTKPRKRLAKRKGQR